MLVAKGHKQPIGVAHHRQQPRMLAQAITYLQAQRRHTVEAVQPRTQGLAIVPERRCVMGAVVTVDLPLLPGLIQQRQGQTGNMPALRQTLDLLAQHLGQPCQAAQAQLLAHSRGEMLQVFTVFRSLAALEQVTDIHRLQQPAALVRLKPATSMHNLSGQAVEVQVQALPEPIRRHAFDRQVAGRRQQIPQRISIVVRDPAR